MSIAKTIHQQLTQLTPTQVIWSWGASKWQMLGASDEPNKSVKGVNEAYLGGLMFYVRGRLHKGHVLITLNTMDEYTITIGHVRKGVIKPKAQKTGIHFDMLGTIIDEMIETPNSYEEERKVFAAKVLA